jgi:hypothetical protein
MKFLIFTLFFSAPAFSMTPEAFKNGLERLYSEQKEKIQLCNNQNQSIIQKGYKTVENPSNPDEMTAFIENEKDALAIIESVDIKKIIAPSEEKSEAYFLNNCNKNNFDIYEKLNKDRPVCFNINDELDFMRALIFATKNYPWSAETKEKAKKLIFTYVQARSEYPNQPLIGNMVAANLIYLMANYNLIPTKLGDEAKKINADAENSREEWLKKTKNKNKNLTITSKSSCKPYVNYLRTEIEVSNELGKKIQGILKKVN